LALCNWGVTTAGGFSNLTGVSYATQYS
jgi:hypothetical protein